MASACSCGCNTVTVVSEAQNACSCGCAEQPKTRMQEIADLVTLRKSIDQRLAELEPEKVSQ